MTTEIQPGCLNGNCKKSKIEKVNCRSISEYNEDDLPQLDRWNKGKGYHIFLEGINSDPVTWNNLRNSQPGATVYRGS